MQEFMPLDFLYHLQFRVPVFPRSIFIYCDLSGVNSATFLVAIEDVHFILAKMIEENTGVSEDELLESIKQFFTDNLAILPEEDRVGREEFVSKTTLYYVNVVCRSLFRKGIEMGKENRKELEQFLLELLSTRGAWIFLEVKTENIYPTVNVLNREVVLTREPTLPVVRGNVYVSK